MNEDLTMRWINKIVERFALSRRLLAWDSFEEHLKDPVKNLQKEMNTESAIVLGGCTKYIHGPDVVWNKSFKSKITKIYDK